MTSIRAVTSSGDDEHGATAGLELRNDRMDSPPRDAAPGRQARGAQPVEGIHRLGAVTDLLTAARLLGVGRTKAYQLARTGAFPVSVIRVGGRYRVPVAPLLRLLGLDPATPAGLDLRAAQSVHDDVPTSGFTGK